MKLHAAVFLLAGIILLPHTASAGEFIVGQGSERATLVGYYKVTPPKIRPEDIKKEEADKPKPKKKHHRHRRNSHSPLHIDQVAPQKEMPPTLVPHYDTRPDTGPRD